MKEKEDRNELIESDDVTSFNERTNENFESSSYQHQSAFELAFLQASAAGKGRVFHHGHLLGLIG